MEQSLCVPPGLHPASEEEEYVMLEVPSDKQSGDGSEGDPQRSSGSTHQGLAPDLHALWPQFDASLFCRQQALPSYPQALPSYPLSPQVWWDYGPRMTLHADERWQYGPFPGFLH